MFVIAECLRIYAVTVRSRHLSAHLVILVTWVYALTSVDTNMSHLHIPAYLAL